MMEVSTVFLLFSVITSLWTIGTTSNGGSNSKRLIASGRDIVEGSEGTAVTVHTPVDEVLQRLAADKATATGSNGHRETRDAEDDPTYARSVLTGDDSTFAVARYSGLINSEVGTAQLIIVLD